MILLTSRSMLSPIALGLGKYEHCTLATGTPANALHHPTVVYDSPASGGGGQTTIQQPKKSFVGDKQLMKFCLNKLKNIEQLEKDSDRDITCLPKKPKITD